MPTLKSPSISPVFFFNFGFQSLNLVLPNKLGAINHQFYNLGITSQGKKVWELKNKSMLAIHNALFLCLQWCSAIVKTLRLFVFVNEWDS